MIGQALLRTTLALGLVALVTGCAEMEPPVTTAPAPTPPQGYWNGDGVPGSPKIIVSLSEQRAYFFKGKHLVGETTVSTGKPGFSTPPGSYTVLSKDATHVSTVFGDYVDDFGNVTKSNIDVRKDSKPPGSHYDGARMPFAMFFRGGYAMHQGYVPPYAASHGCIRIPQSMAEIFFNAAPVGTPVIVKQEAVVHSVPVPALNPVSPPAPAPNLVRSTAPAAVRPATVRYNVPTPTPPALRSPAPMLYRAPAPVPSPLPIRSPAPGPFRGPSPVPLRSPSPAPVLVPRSATIPSPTPVRSLAPGTFRGPFPGSLRSPSPTPVHAPSPVPVRPTTSGPSRTHRPVHSRTPVRLPAPSPTPTPTPRR